MEWKRAKKAWLRKNGFPNRCSVCKRKLVQYPPWQRRYRANRRTIDHIIPKVLLFELELTELLFDLDNFAIMCDPCNVIKGDAKLDIHSLSPELLKKFHAAVDKRNASA